MISISFLITAGIILLLNRAGLIKYPLVVILVSAIIIGVSAFAFRGRLNCPFVKRYPFTICPFNRR